MYYPCSENKGADQLRGYREADLRLCFRICKRPVFSGRSSYLTVIMEIRLFTFCYIQIWPFVIRATSGENLLFAYAKTKVQISCAVTPQLISAFVSASQIAQSLYFLNPKFQASSHLQLYIPVFVGRGRKLEDRFSSDAAHFHTIRFEDGVMPPIGTYASNKGADQLCSNCAADQLLCFHYTDRMILLHCLLKLIYLKTGF